MRSPFKIAWSEHALHEENRVTPASRIFVTVLLLCALLPRASHADNGQVAWAFPASGIVVDGDPSEWPGDLPIYHLELPEYGVPPTDSLDLTATMQVAYDADAPVLYIRVDVVDQSKVVGPAQLMEWDQRDGLEIYVGTDVASPEPLLTIHELTSREQWEPGRQVLTVQETLYGDSRYSIVGINGVVPEDSTLAGRIERRSTARGFTYEASFDLRRFAGDDYRIEPYSNVAFDLVVNDHDEDGSFTWMAWGPLINKVAGRQRQGDLLFVARPLDTPRVVEATEALRRESAANLRDEILRLTVQQGLFSGVLGVVSVIHLLLRVFGVQRRPNLFYALATASSAILIYVSYSALTGSVPLTNQATTGIVLVATQCAGHFSLLFLYGLFDRPLRWWYGVLLAATLSAVVVWLGSWIMRAEAWFLGGQLLSALCILGLAAEAVRVVITAVLRHQEGARTIAAGVIGFLVTAFYIYFIVDEIGLLHVVAFLSPVLAVSVYLARNVAHTSLELAASNEALAAANRQVTEATQNKSQFLRQMSHDLRSPMNAIIGYTRLLRRRLEGHIEERDARNLANIETSSNNLLGLINDILDLSRIESGRIDVTPRDMDPRALANECADALESIVSQSVVLRRDLDDVGAIHSDPDRLRQVVMNLLGNAAKFTNEGSISLSLKRVDRAVELAVADTGIGIPADDLPHIFEEFRRVEREGAEPREGSGLGLAIAKKTVELLGGEISATSEVGVGTTFAVRLPA